jgi:GNAT superfamily N-acetyltransferase
MNARPSVGVKPFMGTVQLLDISNVRDLERAFGVFSHLRPRLNLATFLQRVHTQAAEGYKIVYSEIDGEIVSAAGFRVASFLAWGKVLYIDDLITHPQRKRLGLGGALLDWLIDEASRLGCDEVHLDTGFERHDAHRPLPEQGL